MARLETNVCLDGHGRTRSRAARQRRGRATKEERGGVRHGPYCRAHGRMW